MSRQIPCANNRVSGCQGLVSQRGNIFCDTCNDTRKNIAKSRREQDIDDLVNKNADLEKELNRLRQVHNEFILKNTSNVETELKSQLADLEKEHQKKIAEYQLQIKLLEMKRKEADDNHIENKRLQQLNEELSKNNKNLQEINAELEKVNTVLKKNQSDSSKYILYNSQLEKENARLTELLVKLRNDNQNLVKERQTYEMTYSQLKIDSQKISLDNTRLKEQNAKLLSQNEELTKENGMLSKLNEDLARSTLVTKTVPKKVNK